jgi:hypothetical protein
MTAPRRHLRVVDSGPAVADLQAEVRDLTLRAALAKSILNQRSWPGCEHEARLVRMALDGASIDQLKEEDQRK